MIVHILIAVGVWCIFVVTALFGCGKSQEERTYVAQQTVAKKRNTSSKEKSPKSKVEKKGKKNRRANCKPRLKASKKSELWPLEKKMKKEHSAKSSTVSSKSLTTSKKKEERDKKIKEPSGMKNLAGTKAVEKEKLEESESKTSEVSSDVKAELLAKIVNIPIPPESEVGMDNARSSTPQQASPIPVKAKEQIPSVRGDVLNVSIPSHTKKNKEDIELEPCELRWNAMGGLKRIQITNPGSERCAIKVKCSDNVLYRVSPVFSFIEPGQKISVDVVRYNGGRKVDKLVFVTVKASANDTDPRILFKRTAAKPMIALPLVDEAT